MEKVYCKKCRHVYKIEVGYSETEEYHCFHSKCFKNSDKDTPFSQGKDNKGNYTSERITNMDKLNANNNCEYFEERINIFKRIASVIKEYFS